MLLRYYHIMFLFVTLCFVVCCLLNTFLLFLLFFQFSSYFLWLVCSMSFDNLVLYYLSWITMPNMTNTENLENISISFLFVWPHPIQNTIMYPYSRREQEFSNDILIFQKQSLHGKMILYDKAVPILSSVWIYFFPFFPSFLRIFHGYWLSIIYSICLFILSFYSRWDAIGCQIYFKLNWALCLVQYISCLMLVGE